MIKRRKADPALLIRIWDNGKPVHEIQGEAKKVKKSIIDYFKHK